MPKILFHSLVFSPDSVSTSYLMTDLAKQLKSIGHDVTVLTTSPHYNIDREAVKRQNMKSRWFGLLGRSDLDGIDVWHVRIPMKGQRVYSRVFDYLYFHKMSLFIGFFFLKKHDLVLTPSPPLTMGLVGWLLGWKMNAPYVYNIQEIYPDFAINQGLIRNPLLIKFLRWIESVVYAKSAKIVSISQWFNDIVVRRNVPKEKLEVIPNFVDTELYHPLPRDNWFAREHNLLDKFVVLYGGNIGLSQDWEALLHTAAELSVLPIEFVLVGDGAVSKWLRAEVETRQLRNIRFLGYQPRQMMAMANASSDVCMIPMKSNTTIDTFPSKIYTILACGKAVIVQADPNSELEWLMKKVDCGYVAVPDDARSFTDAVRAAYENRGSLQEKGRRGLELVRAQYSKEVVGMQYDRLVRELTEKISRG
ncbi:glycosyltransferase family 4 protein [Sphingobacteriales bacterium CHB3]|nr:glycosyltransferase family 4 protein [Sphingobacteriales bacterium CHB3]